MKSRIFFSIACLSVSAYALTYSGGSGTLSNPFLISTAADVNSIGVDPNDWNKYFKLTADVNMSAYSSSQYKIIGNTTKPFTGTFDGNGHTISNLTYTNAVFNYYYLGMFGYTSYATIKNLGLENVNINGHCAGAGALVGYQDNGTDSNCFSTGSVSVFSTWSSISATYAGGLVGSMNKGTIKSCFSECSVNSVFYVSRVSYAGGLIGNQYISSILNCYSTGSVYASSSSAYAGGFIGIMSGDSTAVLRNCYSTGQPTTAGSTQRKGGFIGMFSGTGIIRGCFWDKNTSSLDNGIGEGSSSYVVGKTTAEMQTLSTFTNAGWDFIDETTNGANNYWQMPVNDYPRLAWEDILFAGDFNKDGIVDYADLYIFMSQWLCEELNYNLYTQDNLHIVNFFDWNLFAKNSDGDFVELSNFANEWLEYDAYNADIAGNDDFVNFLDYSVFAENWMK
jgi:hypothetical protein